MAAANRITETPSVVALASTDAIATIQSIVDFLRWLEPASDVSPGSDEAKMVARLILLDALNSAVQSIEAQRVQ